MYRHKGKNQFVCHIAPVLFVAALALSGCGGGSGGGTASAPVPVSAVSRAVTAAREQYKLPALAAAVVSADGITTDAQGLRKLGGAASATREDRFHVGSNTKAMTASLIAVFVEEGKLAWDTKVVDVFPELASTVRPEYRDATLDQLLRHRTGLPGYESLDEILTLPTFSGDIAARRRAFTAYVLAQPPDATPGAVPGEFRYSNAGYVVAAAMLEKVAGKSWETLMQERLFRPLGIGSAGFGWPATGNPNQPNGHVADEGGALTPHDEDNPAEQFPDLFSPAGNVYLSVGDFARFAQMHLRGLEGRRDLLRPETIQRLHAPTGNYAGGWVKLDIGGVPTSAHDGSADTFFSVAAIQPSRGRAVVTVTNAGGEQAGAAANALTSELLNAGR